MEFFLCLFLLLMLDNWIKDKVKSKNKRIKGMFKFWNWRVWDFDRNFGYDWLECVVWCLIYYVNWLFFRWCVNMIDCIVSMGSDLFCVLWVVVCFIFSKY